MFSRVVTNVIQTVFAQFLRVSLEECALGAPYPANLADFTLSSIYFYNLPSIMAPMFPSIPASKHSFTYLKLLFCIVLFILVFLLLYVSYGCVHMYVNVEGKLGDSKLYGPLGRKYILNYP